MNSGLLANKKMSAWTGTSASPAPLEGCSSGPEMSSSRQRLAELKPPGSCDSARICTICPAPEKPPSRREKPRGRRARLRPAFPGKSGSPTFKKVPAFGGKVRDFLEKVQVFSGKVPWFSRKVPCFPAFPRLKTRKLTRQNSHGCLRTDLSYPKIPLAGSCRRLKAGHPVAFQALSGAARRRRRSLRPARKRAEAVPDLHNLAR